MNNTEQTPFVWRNLKWTTVVDWSLLRHGIKNRWKPFMKLPRN